jgi:hypothetical protein
MRKFISAAMLLSLVLPAAAQQSAAPAAPLPDSPGWSRVESLYPGANLHISLVGRSSGCRFKIADDNSLTCAAANEVFQRSDIKKIIIPRRGRSALIGLAIGAGLGLIVGAADGDKCSNKDIICFSRGDLAAVGAVVFAPIGALVGALTDFAHTTVYRRP